MAFAFGRRVRPLRRVACRPRGFTVVEALVVAAVVALALAMALPALQQAREASRLEQCQNNLKQLGVALHSYHETHDRFPYSTTYSVSAPGQPGEGHTWTEFLLPYMDMSAVYLKLDFRVANREPANARVLEELKLPWQSCPSNQESQKISYWQRDFFEAWKAGTQGQFYAPCTGTQIGYGNTGWDCHALGLKAGSYCCTEGSEWDSAAPAANPGMFGGRNPFSAALKDVADGTGSTFLLGERRAELLFYGGAFSVNFPGAPTGMKLNSKLTNHEDVNDWHHNWGFSSRHEGGANFLFVDGKVRFINDAIDYETYCRLSDKADGNKVKDF
jgi:prepilin-type processing-associated H-X9-DG protein